VNLKFEEEVESESDYGEPVWGKEKGVKESVER
jgi:hypothetical protein